MQLGQAAGTIAALSQIEGKTVKQVGVRNVQKSLLASGCYIMPYLDLPKDHRHFKAVQRIGATGILRGEGRNVGWANQTWFRADDPLLAEEIFTEGLYDGSLGLGEGPVTIGNMFAVLRGIGLPLHNANEAWWNGLGLDNFDENRVVTRLEAAVVMDAAFDPFSMFNVDYNGNFTR